MKTGIYELRLYTDNKEWPRRKLPGFMGPELPENASVVPMTLEMFEEDGQMKAILTAPNGKQKVDAVICDKYSAAFRAFAGKTGDEWFDFVITGSDSSAAVWGYAAAEESFTGYIAIEGSFVA